MKVKTKKIGIILCSISIATITVFTFFLNYLSLNTFDNLFEQYLGKTADTTSGDTKGADVEYVKSSFESASDLYAYEEELVAEIAMEGITLLKNDGVLPLSKGTELSLFSHSSVDLVSGGSGSGSGSFELTADLKEGLENAGLSINETLWDFYDSGNGSGYTRGEGSINYGASLDWKINECPLNVILNENGLIDSFDGTTAVYVLSRTGGEGADLARDMEAYGGEAGQHYLEPDATELEIIGYLNENFEDVILLVNTNNVMELGWVEDYENISAVVNFPGAGRTGTYGLGYMLTGLDSEGNQVSPSGHLVDTFAYDNFSSPAMQNMGDYNYEGTSYYYVNYAESIYVGYKYYETRYEDAVLNQGNAVDYDYSSTVLYPFGYGKSYTEFTWSDFSISEVDENGDIEVNLKVTNTGDYYGKEVVQVYVTVPYSTYDKENGVEKSSVTLVGFEKTDNLAPNQEEEISITINLEDFISYDSEGAKTYILENGTYYITAASDAHQAINNVLVAKGVDNVRLDSPGVATADEYKGDASFVGIYEQELFDSITYATGENDTKITNLFDDAKLTDAAYLSRSNWSVLDNDGLRYGTASTTTSGAEIGGKQRSHTITNDLKEALDSDSSGNPNEGTIIKTYEWGQENDIDLVDLRGKDYDDSNWDLLLDEIELDELSLLIDESGYCTPEIKSINKPKITDLDGPAGLNLVVGHGSVDIGDDLKSMTWPSEYLLACTWNTELALAMGEGVGEDGLYGGVSGWYGPAVNIHRTPFAGRNFEYYSEDGFLSGAFGKEVVQGAARKGMYAFLKHFALNDQETNRDKLGLVTWADEQSIREIYLKPFEMTVIDNYVDVQYNDPIYDENGELTGYNTETACNMPAATAIMSSFNRIGTIWAGGNYNLLTGVLRNEWGFNGFVLTDYEVADYMFTSQCLAAGGDAKLKTVGLSGNFLFGYSLEGDYEDQYYAREAAHHILYTVVNSSAMNGYIHGIRYVSGFAYYKIILIVWDVLAAIGVGVLIYFLIKKIKYNLRLKQSEEANE